VTLVPGSVDFGTVAQGAQPNSQSVAVTNSGNAALTISSVLLGGANPGDFSMTNNCTSSPIQVQAKCSISITFSPQAQGQRSATIKLTDDAADSPQTINVTGNVASAFQLTPARSGATSATVSAGQTAQYALQISPGPGFTGNISLTCSGAPVGAACTITPGTITVTNSNAVPFSVSVGTSGSAIVRPDTGGGRSHGFVGLQSALELVSVGFAVFLVWSLARAREARFPAGSVAYQLSAVALLCFLSVGVSGCGGGSTTAQVTPASPPTNPQPVVTPPGTSSLTVTATSGNLPVQTIVLSLTVQ
jgi:HYDIN/CFA65/VesB-like, Ig-like domain